MGCTLALEVSQREHLINTAASARCQRRTGSNNCFNSWSLGPLAKRLECVRHAGAFIPASELAELPAQ